MSACMWHYHEYGIIVIPLPHGRWEKVLQQLRRVGRACEDQWSEYSLIDINREKRKLKKGPTKQMGGKRERESTC